MTVESGNSFAISSARVTSSGKGQPGLLGANHVIPCCAELGSRGGAEKLQQA